MCTRSTEYDRARRDQCREVAMLVSDCRTYLDEYGFDNCASSNTIE